MHQKKSMILAQKKLIIFDWDGTLANSISHIVIAMQQAAKSVNQTPAKRLDIQPLIGMGLIEVINKLYPKISQDTLTSFQKAYKEAYLHSPKCCLFEGVEDLLSDLTKKKILLAIATGKSRSGLNRALEQTGVGHYFLDTKTADETASKPHPLMLEELLQIAQVNVDQALMIGDAECDMQMAVSIGMMGIGVETGGGTRQSLIKAGAQRVLSHVLQLNTII